MNDVEGGGASASASKLAWLRRLRWTAVAGQTATLIGVERGLGVALPMAAALSVVAFTVATNVGLHFVPAGRGESPRCLAAVLGLDVVLLTALLGLTGGPHNPFATLYLVLVALAAAALTPGWAWSVAGLSAAGYGWLFLSPVAWPRPGDPLCGVGPNLPLRLHLLGMMVAFLVTAVLVAYFVGRLQQGLRTQAHALAIARERAAEHERFAAIATLAAGAAHELGTPLGTIVVAAGELAREVARGGESASWLEDADLIRREAFRCRRILDRLQQHADDAPTELDPVRIFETLRARYPGVIFEGDVAPDASTVVAPREALTQALTNLIGNAIDASPVDRPVRATWRRTDRAVEFVVADEGPGLSPEVRAHAGEPFFTTKPSGQGMGLGLFLVRLLARRASGELRFETPSGGGTRAILSLPVLSGRGNP